MAKTPKNRPAPAGTYAANMPPPAVREEETAAEIEPQVQPQPQDDEQEENSDEAKAAEDAKKAEDAKQKAKEAKQATNDAKPPKREKGTPAEINVQLILCVNGNEVDTCDSSSADWKLAKDITVNDGDKIEFKVRARPWVGMKAVYNCYRFGLWVDGVKILSHCVFLNDLKAKKGEIWEEIFDAGEVTERGTTNWRKLRNLIVRRTEDMTAEPKDAKPPAKSNPATKEMKALGKVKVEVERCAHDARDDKHDFKSYVTHRENGLIPATWIGMEGVESDFVISHINKEPYSPTHEFRETPLGMFYACKKNTTPAFYKTWKLVRAEGHSKDRAGSLPNIILQLPGEKDATPEVIEPKKHDKPKRPKQPKIMHEPTGPENTDKEAVPVTSSGNQAQSALSGARARVDQGTQTPGPVAASEDIDMPDYVGSLSEVENFDGTPDEQIERGRWIQDWAKGMESHYLQVIRHHKNAIAARKAALVGLEHDLSGRKRKREAEGGEPSGKRQRTSREEQDDATSNTAAEPETVDDGLDNDPLDKTFYGFGNDEDAEELKSLNLDNPDEDKQRQQPEVMESEEEEQEEEEEYEGPGEVEEENSDVDAEAETDDEVEDGQGTAAGNQADEGEEFDSGSHDNSGSGDDSEPE